MILLDTNVVSALMRRDHDTVAIAWLDSQPAESVWTTSVSVFEVQMGLELLESGRRRRLLEEAFGRVLEEDLGNRVVSFDSAAAVMAGRIAARQRRSGRTVEIRDVQIAGITTARKSTLATRNTRHFEGIGLTLVNPWSSQVE